MCDPSLFIYNHQSYVVYMLVYVDEIIITGNFPFLQHLIQKWIEFFSLNQLGNLD